MTSDLKTVITEIVQLRQFERPLTSEESDRLYELDGEKMTYICFRDYYRGLMYNFLLSPNATQEERRRLAQYCDLKSNDYYP